MRSHLRTIVEGCVWILLAAGAMETWLVAGLAVPCRVVGDSMAETLRGAHREIQCADCGRRFTCGVDPQEARSQAICPNCGYPANDLRSRPELKGDRLLIDRTGFSLRQPQRWEVVALRHPQRANDILVKRVVGLPGESIEIRDGDVYADGQIQRKNLAQQHAMAILVHDAECRPTLEPAAGPRWQPKSPEAAGNRPVVVSRILVMPKTAAIDWLVYHHGRRVSAGKSVEMPVTDLCGYNQSQPRRDEDIHAVRDLLLSFWLEPVGKGTLFVRATDGGEVFEVRLHFRAAGIGPGMGMWRYEAFQDRKLMVQAATGQNAPTGSSSRFR